MAYAVANANTVDNANRVGHHELRKHRTEGDPMIARYRKTTHRLIRTARGITKSVAYWILSERVAPAVAAGHLIKTGDFLDRVGGGDLPDGQKSWFGRHAKKAYIAATGQQPLMVWARHRTTSRYIHVCVYGPIDLALYEGLRTYKGTRHLLAGSYAEAA
jgi:hypothetical protein